MGKWLTFRSIYTWTAILAQQMIEMRVNYLKLTKLFTHVYWIVPLSVQFYNVGKLVEYIMSAFSTACPEFPLLLCPVLGYKA